MWQNGRVYRQADRHCILASHSNANLHTLAPLCSPIYNLNSTRIVIVLAGWLVCSVSFPGRSNIMNWLLLLCLFSRYNSPQFIRAYICAINSAKKFDGSMASLQIFRWFYRSTQIRCRLLRVTTTTTSTLGRVYSIRSHTLLQLQRRARDSPTEWSVHIIRQDLRLLSRRLCHRWLHSHLRVLRQFSNSLTLLPGGRRTDSQLQIESISTSSTSSTIDICPNLSAPPRWSIILPFITVVVLLIGR